jgi:hypothetical protein
MEAEYYRPVEGEPDCNRERELTFQHQNEERPMTTENVNQGQTTTEAQERAARRAAAIERIRQERKENAEKDRIDGFEAGEEWAMDAEADVLDRLHRLSLDIHSFDNIRAGTEEAREDFFSGVIVFGATCSAEFWEDVAGDREPSGAFVSGFARAALKFNAESL